MKFTTVLELDSKLIEPPQRKLYTVLTEKAVLSQVAMRNLHLGSEFLKIVVRGQCYQDVKDGEIERFFGSKLLISIVKSYRWLL